tara:strand:- start:11071 stop:11595 length:525 start_codon:yes stop_codon:yes gene_type:complete
VKSSAVHYGRIPSSKVSVKKLIRQFESKYPGATINVVYEAGPCGNWIYRLITSLEHCCYVVAPSLIPKKPGEHTKTDRRDALADVPPDKMRDANTLGAILMQMNRGLGITLSALAIAVAALILGQSAETPDLTTFTIAMAFMAILALVSITDSLLLSKEDGDAVLNKRKGKKSL